MHCELCRDTGLMKSLGSETTCASKPEFVFTGNRHWKVTPQCQRLTIVNFNTTHFLLFQDIKDLKYAMCHSCLKEYSDHTFCDCFHLPVKNKTGINVFFKDGYHFNKDLKKIYQHFIFIKWIIFFNYLSLIKICTDFITMFYNPFPWNLQYLKYLFVNNPPLWRYSVW